MGFALLKYTLILLNILLYSQTELDTTSKMQIQSCSKLFNQKYPEKPAPEVFSKMILSCFIKITQSQSEKIFNSKETDPSPLSDEEIELLFDMNNLNEIPEEELKQKSDLIEQIMKEKETPKKNLRNLVDADEEDIKGQEKDLNASVDNNEIKDDDEDDDDDDNYNDMNYNDTNYYGDDDMNDTEGMYDDYYKDYYDDDYYDDDYWKNGNYDAFGNMSDEDYAVIWKAEEYKGKDVEGVTTQFFTDNGERVRSKSEVLIANTLRKYKVPYKYEYPVRLKNGMIIYVDFLALNVHTREQFFWEHLGMMDHPEYAAKAIAKVEGYEETGIYQGKNLILTFETSGQPLKTKAIERMIQRYLL